MFPAMLLLLLSMVMGGAASAVDEDDPAWSACWTSFEPPVCEAEDVLIPKVGCFFKETCDSKWSLCSVKIPEFRHSVGVSGYARRTSVEYVQIPTLPDFVQVLDLSSKFQLTFLNDTFANVPHITGLILKDADVRYILEGLLVGLKNLTCINLDNNPYLGEYFVGLQTATLEQILLLPSLRRFSARNCNFLLTWGKHSFKDRINNVNLLSLSLSGNSVVESVTLQSFQKLVCLRDLDLSNCSIQFLDPLFYVPSYSQPDLQILNLSHNFISDFPWYPPNEGQSEIVSSLFPKLTMLDLSYNKFGYFVHHLERRPLLPRVQHLNISHNSFQVIYPRSFLPASGFPALRHLDLSLQNVPTVNVEATILQIPSLLSLNLENKKLTFNTPPVNASSDVEFSKRNSKLRELYVSGNALRQFNEQKLLDLLGHLHDLETLSLANSKLDFVSATVFSNFPKLRVLNLRDNAINVIDEGCFDPLTVLSHLDLSNNKIPVISHRTFGVLRARLDVVDLGQNPIVCSCDLLWFRDWFMADSKLFSVSDPDYQCQNTPAKTQLADFTMHQQACLLSREVNEGIIFICSFLTITSTTAVLLFRYRWHLRLVFYEAFRGQGDVRKWRLQHGRFEHDVFVSYAREDFNWIRHRLMPQLEDRLHLRLCIHDRQFIPGKNIVDNIADCVESSKKVMMVFSKHFVRSQWCQFELNYCLRHVMEHEDALIIVCLDNVTSLDIMTTAMMAVLKTTTYIQWAEQADAVRSFWGRLEIALDEILPAGEHAL